MSNSAKVHPLILWEEAKGFTASCKALVLVCGLVLFRPADFFRQLLSLPRADLKRRLVHAIIFVFILSYLKLSLDALNLYWLKSVSKEIFPISSQLELSFFSTAILKSPFFLLRPLIAFAVTLSLIACGVKLVFGFDRALLPAFLVICYMSAAGLFYCLPLVGSMLAAVWSLTLLIIGIREVYAVNTLRSILSALVMPLSILFLVVLSVGPSLSRVIISFYPETETRLVRLNDLTAYGNTAAVVSAAEAYKKELGFYPVNLNVLKKYFSGAVSGDLTKEHNLSGYFYLYGRLDDKHFILKATPQAMNETGRFVFYADQTGKIRLNNSDGAWIENIEKMSSLAAGDKV